MQNSCAICKKICKENDGNSIIIVQDNEEMSICDNHYSYEEKEEKDESIDQTETEDEKQYTNDESDDIEENGKQRKYFHPRYVTEITLDDVRTEPQIRQILNLVKGEEKKKAQKIKALNERHVKLVEHLNTLHNSIKTLSYEFNQIKAKP